MTYPPYTTQRLEEVIMLLDQIDDWAAHINDCLNRHRVEKGPHGDVLLSMDGESHVHLSLDEAYDMAIELLRHGEVAGRRCRCGGVVARPKPHSAAWPRSLNSGLWRSGVAWSWLYGLCPTNLIRG